LAIAKKIPTMTPSSFDNFFQKVKTSAKQAADTTAKQAKIAKFRMNLMTLHTEKSRYLQTIGVRVYSMYSQTKTLDPGRLFDEVKDDLGNIERIDIRVQEIEENIAELKSKDAELEIKDVTEAPPPTEEQHEPPKQS
jgi:hypothetical protein